MSDLPQDIIIHHLFPSLPLSKVIQITELRPDLLPKTKDYICKLGKSIGMKNINDPKQVFNNLHVSKTQDEIFEVFYDFYCHDVISFICSWVDKFTLDVMDRDKIMSEWKSIMNKMYPFYLEDMNRNLDIVFGKSILHPDVYMKNRGKYGIFTRMFPNLYRVFYEQMKVFLTDPNVFGSNQFDPKTFLSTDGKDIHHVIIYNTTYNFDRMLNSLLFR